MAEKECSSFYLNMDIKQQDKQDISKVFVLLRNKLNAKEKELLELQRAQPSLLAPDAQQIDAFIDAISSLHLSTQDGSFIFASNSNESSSTATTVCSTGVDSITTLPSTTWLSESKSEENELRLPMVTHLLSLPFNAFVKLSSSSPSTTSTPTPAATPVDTSDQPPNRLPMVSELLSMPIDAFRSSSSSDKKSLPMPIEEKKQTANTEVTTTTAAAAAPKSIFDTEKTYSKEHWLKKSSPSKSESEFVHLDLDEYIEQSSEKMRRLHMEYHEALGKITTPPNPTDPTQTLKSMYPQMFERINQDMSPETLTRLLPSKK